MQAQPYFRHYWAHCPPVVDLFESLAAAAAEDHVNPAGPGAFQPHLSVGAVDEALASGSVMRVCALSLQLSALI